MCVWNEFILCEQYIQIRCAHFLNGLTHKISQLFFDSMKNNTHTHTQIIYIIDKSLWFLVFRTTPGRIVGAVWWFFTVILISSYVSNFTAYLIVQKMSTPISTPEDLAAQTEIEYGILAHGSTWDFFKVSYAI